jgi:hypothetical protein
MPTERGALEEGRDSRSLTRFFYAVVSRHAVGFYHPDTSADCAL